MACKWINGEFSQGTKYRRNKRQFAHGGKREIAKPISNIDSFVNHVYREHNEEADQWANIGTQGRRKIVIDRRDDPTTWKAIRGVWDGSFKDNGRSGCGIVIKGFDMERCVTIIQLAVLLKSGCGNGG